MRDCCSRGRLLVKFNSESGIKNITRKKLKFFVKFSLFVVCCRHASSFVIPMFYLFFQTLKTVKTLKIELINLFTSFYYIIFLKANNDIFLKLGR